MSEKITGDAAFIQMFENSVKAQELTDGELLDEVCLAFSDHEIHSWKDALLTELTTRFQAAIGLEATPSGLTWDGNKSKDGSDNPNTEQTLGNAFADNTIPAHLSDSVS